MLTHVAFGKERLCHLLVDGLHFFTVTTPWRLEHTRQKTKTNYHDKGASAHSERDQHVLRVILLENQYVDH